MDPEGLGLLDLLEPEDAALDHAEAALGHFLHEGEGQVPGGFPGIQVAAHGAHDVGPGLHGPGQLQLGGHFHHHVEPLADGELQQGLQALLGEHGWHEVDGIGAEDLALLDLVLLEDEVPADEGHLHLGTHLGEVLVLAEVEELVCGDGEGLGTVFGQTLGVGGGLVGFPHLTPAWIAPGHFTQDGDSRLAELFLERVVTLVAVLNRHGSPLLLDFHIEGLEYGDFL